MFFLAAEILVHLPELTACGAPLGAALLARPGDGVCAPREAAPLHTGVGFARYREVFLRERALLSGGAPDQCTLHGFPANKWVRMF